MLAGDEMIKEGDDCFIGLEASREMIVKINEKMDALPEGAIPSFKANLLASIVEGIKRED